MKKSVVLGFLVMLISCTGFYNEHITLIDAQEFNEMTALIENPQIIDVRTPKEFDNGAIPKAVNIDLNDDDFEKKITVFDKEKPVFVYCRSGIRSQDASKLIAEKGFQSVYELSGGYVSWKKLDNE
ncbi:Rhodanese-related sulfurtransferase [Pustulibacterium marinum]|uniref:Rhodanese-related sulfurtransferase n=1 Tax=Pustulibacterium marinum TaxID=1224947 RepID=A0A1I7F0Q6_9FLAO|nr:rhodanese-like domain-containing protein [Pustulibacterium marinum]SFU29714.1 Rhodanese-related sulfurtransferase [Pustulibacterium marinum]